MNATRMTAEELAARCAALAELAQGALRHFDAVDVIALPTAPIPPPRLDEVPDWDRYRALNLRMVRNTCLANLLGLNGLTLPIALDPLGLPVGLQVMAAPQRDDLLFGAGLAFERVLGTLPRRPG